jgi:enoyl-CoA hydratase/carnithine racemase
MTESPPVRVEFEKAIANVIFDQPNARANTLSTVIWESLAVALASVANHGDVKGLIVSSTKEGIFIAGADLKELHELIKEPGDITRRLLKAGLDVLSTLESLPFPTVAMIDGAALGGGLEVAMACDYRLAGSHPKCKLGLPEVTLGLIPGWGGTQRLPRIVGPTVGVELLLTGRTMTSSEAKAVGLVDEVVASDQLRSAAVAMLSRQDWPERRRRKKAPASGTLVNDWSAQIALLADDIRPAANVVLQVVTKGAALPLEQATAIETDAFVPLIHSDAAQSRIQAFLKK